MSARAAARAGLVLLASLTALGCRSSLPPERAVTGSAGLLREQTTRSEISDWLGRPAHRCIGLEPGLEMCEWRVGDRDPHYRELSTYLGVEERIGVLCVLPLDGSPRGVDSCTLHQRRSNRDRFRSPGFGPGSRGHSLSDVLAELEAEARRYVADARTLPEMSRALGQLPESCLASGDERRCEWVLSNGSAGHGAAVRLVGGDMQRKLRFACLFPPDAGPRRDGSCDGEAP